MAKDITILGASYSDVPAVVLPQTGGGTARFDDCSVVTATAEDVAQGKVFVANDGTITTGTATGGGGGGTGGVHVDADGYLVLDDEASETKYTIADVVAGEFDENLDLTGVTSMTRGYVFLNSTVKTINAPDLSRVTPYAFYGAKNLETINEPLANGADEYGFAGCSNLTTVIHKYDYSLSPRSFKDCTSLQMFVCNPVGVYTDCFSGCRNLEALDLGSKMSATRAGCFSNCTKLAILIIRATTMVALANTTLFNGSPFASNGAGGTLYVPSDLISSYQSATNWSTILGYPNNQILAIEGSYYETHYADGTEIPT